jgi:nucleoside-diphosphate-sugar epimerase
MKRNHFVTGATGFVGGALVLELLKKTDDHIYCLVRGADIYACVNRLKECLYLSASLYGEDMFDLINTRCFAVRGDLHYIYLPESVRNGLIKFDYIWHCAASLKFSDKDREYIDYVNVEGTKRLCQLSNTLSVANFIYMSTAYVAGKTQGVIDEKVVDVDRPTNNFYEKSKVLAEYYLLTFCNAKLKILRPSIVIGHRTTLAAASNSGLYGFIIDLSVFRRRFGKALESLQEHTPLKIVSVAEDTINLVPIDYVAESAITIGLSDTDKTIFHLTNDTPGKVKDGMEVIFESMNLQKPSYVSSKFRFRKIDLILDHSLCFYSSYLSGIKIFDRANALPIKDMYPLSYNLDKELLGQYVNWFIAYLKRTRPKLYPGKHGENLTLDAQ